MISIPLSGTHYLAGRPGTVPPVLSWRKAEVLIPSGRAAQPGSSRRRRACPVRPSMAERDQHIAPWLQAGATAAADLAALLLQPLQSQ
jgi:hypothetical protein